MPELPEIFIISNQMNKSLRDKKISSVDIKQPKILNISEREFITNIKEKTFDTVKPEGKWIFAELKPDYHLLINLGMGGDIIYFEKFTEIPGEYHFRMDFEDKTGLTVKFSWFGHIHLVKTDELDEHKPTKDLAKSPVDDDFTLEYFKTILKERPRKGIKSFLMDQKIISGIGNVYIQDILYIPGIHPLSKIGSLNDTEISTLFKAIKNVLTSSIKSAGLQYERDFYGVKGKYSINDMLVGYKEGKPCPECNTTIEKIKTGSTSTYICPECQKEK
jgi:formamidopyrimidine-DNA glycosylase